MAELQLNVNQAVVTEPVKVEQYPVKKDGIIMKKIKIMDNNFIELLKKNNILEKDVIHQIFHKNRYYIILNNNELNFITTYIVI